VVIIFTVRSHSRVGSEFANSLKRVCSSPSGVCLCAAFFFTHFTLTASASSMALMQSALSSRVSFSVLCVVLDKCYPVLNNWVSAIDAQLQTIKTYLINAALKQGCLSTARSLPWLMVPAIAGPSYRRSTALRQDRVHLDWFHIAKKFPAGQKMH